VVVDGETGFLVPLEQHKESPFEALAPDKFACDLAEKINLLMRDPELRKRFAQAGRKRAVEKFSWHAIASATKKKMRISFCTTGSTVYDSSERTLGRRLRFCRGLHSQV
jgi:glycosyltransferase involved in cell wall biosynthesis